MSIDIRVATDSQQWNRYVDQSPQGTFFHEYETLQAQADHANATLRRLVGFKGQEPVGLFPIFELSKGFVTAAFSPPPNLRVPYLGPAFLNMSKLKQRKRERRRLQFVENCFEWVDSELSPAYTHFRTDTEFTDSRPFKWSEYDVTPEHTYHVDLSVGEDDLLSRFSSDARRNITNTPSDSYEIEEGGTRAAEKILEQVRHRYESQDICFQVPTAFVRDLHEQSVNGSLRPYVLRVDGDFVGGILALEYDGTISRWMGGVRTDVDVDVPTNDLLDWRIMSDGIDRGLETYDLVGAETRRINKYKAKFNPELATYYGIEHGKWGLTTAAHLYQSLK